MIDMRADMATGGVLRGDIRTALTPLLRGIVLRGDTRDPLLPDTQGTVVIDPAIAHTHPEADPIDYSPELLPER
jgi:hypothetical protein